MQTASLKEQFINVITYNHGRELWYSRYDQSFEELMDPLLDELAEIAHHTKKTALSSSTYGTRKNLFMTARP